MRRPRPRGWTLDLETAVPIVARSYLTFLRDNEPEPGSKGFVAHHGAAKAALAHLEQLMKLAAGGAEASGGDPAEAALDAARHEMDEEETTADDPGEPG